MKHQLHGLHGGGEEQEGVRGLLAALCQVTADHLERHRTERRRRRRKQEADMNTTVLVICLSFVVCHLPAALLLVFDPSAELFPQVNAKWINIYMSTNNI